MRERLKKARRVVVKLGTHVVTHEGKDVALGRVTAHAEAVAGLLRAGRQPLVVSSGAVAMGIRPLGLSERPTSLGLRQACAAAGQGRLMSLYTRAFAELDAASAQVLLTQDDLADPDRALCLRTTLSRLLEHGAIPVLNENDSVSVRELLEIGEDDRTPAFGDNDELSARVAVAVDADLLLLLTDVDGVYTAAPDQEGARRLATIEKVEDANIETGAVGAGGTGGMASKLAAASLAAEGGVDVVIANGLDAGVIERVLAGDDVGTWIPAPERPRARRQRIAQGSAHGALVVNAGAVRALSDAKASLLPVGVSAVEGEFSTGDLVEIRDESGLIVARGLTNYDAKSCRLVAGLRSDEVRKQLGWRGYDALVTRDNLVMADG